MNKKFSSVINKGRNTFSLFKAGEGIPSDGIRTKKNEFYLNYFYNLLYEKMEQKNQAVGNPSEYFKEEMCYTTGPGFDLPLEMAYKDLEKNAEGYEYEIFGQITTIFEKNNLLFLALYFDNETSLIFQRGNFLNYRIESYLRYFFTGNIVNAKIL